MLIKVSTDTLHRTKAHQYAVRFAFGGAITVIAGLIANKFGPAVGGLFLAFPAIFPAAVTLAQKHEEEKKRERGLNGLQRGILNAADQARGCAIGSVGLAAFAIILWRILPHTGLSVAFPAAIVLWFAVASGLWFAEKRVHLIRKHPVRPAGSALQNPASPNDSDSRRAG